MRVILQTIEFEKEKEFYTGGDVISGKVVINLQYNAKRIRGVEVKLIGKAQTSWTERKKRISIPMNEMEQHVALRKDLLGFGAKNEEITLPQGLTELSFHFVLPFGIPSSFEGKYGGVYYMVESIISYHSAKKTETENTTTKSFQVSGNLDLNLIPNARSSAEMTRAKILYCLCWKSGPIRLSLRILESAFVPGDNIAFMAELVNSSTYTVDVSVALVQHITYYARTGEKREVQNVLQMDGPIMDPGDSVVWKENEFKIPADIPITRLGGGRLVNVEYFMKLSMDCLSAKIPVTIGSVSLRSKDKDMEAYAKLPCIMSLERELSRSLSSPP